MIVLEDDRVTRGLVDWREEEGELRPYVITENGEEPITWKAQPGSQVYFLKCTIEEVLYEGTRGPGKTDALLMDFIGGVGKGWGSEWRGILFRKTYPQLSDVIIKSRKWFPRLFPGAEYNEGKHQWTFPGGETLQFAYGDKEKDYWNYHGKSWPWLAFEELTTWADPTFFLMMFSCCRSSKAGMPRKVRCTTNPYGPGHNWVKLRYALPIATGHTRGPIIKEPGMPTRVAIHGHLDENRILLAADPGYKDKIRAACKGNPTKLKAWMYGDWDIVAGGMFDDVWNPRVHVVPNFIVPAGWRIYRSFDWGSSAPFSVGWWAVSDGGDLTLPDNRVCSTVNGDLFRIAEWYGWNGEPNVGLKMVDTAIAKGIIERELAMNIHERCQAGPADASIFKKENGICIALNLMKQVMVNGRRRSIRFVKSNSKPGTRVSGWELMRDRFMACNPDHRPPGPREFPGLFVCQRCDQFQRTVPVLPRDVDKNPDDVDTDTEDHPADETRYMVMFMGYKGKTTRTKGGVS